jgi:hypothetical protein
MRLPACRLVCVALVVGTFGGCAKEAKMAQLSGKVTFKGKPVPAGWISFQPGIGGGAVKVVQIKDGGYDSAQEKDPGVPPGPMTVRIAGFDGVHINWFPQGKQIFNAWDTQFTVPDGISTRDFAVPESAANNLKIVPTSDDPSLNPR